MSSFLYAYGLSLSQSLGKLLHDLSVSNNPKKVHNFRLTVKKLRALVRLIDSLCNEPSHDYLFKPIKKLYRKSGNLRDLHIQSLLVKQFRKEVPKEIAKFAKWVKSQERIERDQMLKYLQNPNSDIVDKLNSYFIEHSNGELVVGSEDCLNFVKSKIIAIESLAGNNIIIDEILHEIRKHLKEVVYTLQLLKRENLSLVVNEINLNRFNNLQEQLGEWNDWFNLSQKLRQINYGINQFQVLEWYVCVEKEKSKRQILGRIIKELCMDEVIVPQ